MNIKELKEKIKDLPDEMDVMIMQNDIEFALSLSQEAKVKECEFSEGTDSGPRAFVNCLIISDDIDIVQDARAFNDPRHKKR